MKSCVANTNGIHIVNYTPMTPINNDNRIINVAMFPLSPWVGKLPIVEKILKKCSGWVLAEGHRSMSMACPSGQPATFFSFFLLSMCF